MVDYGSSWDPLPSHSVHPNHTNELSLSEVRKKASKHAASLDENKDEQVLKEACLGLCQLFGEGIQNDRIQAILDADVVPKLVALLKPSKSRSVPLNVQSAALQVLGNVACGDDRQTQVVIDSNALPCLRALLSSPERSIRKEVCWIVSNITESSHQVQDVLDADILPPLLKLLDNQDAACREDATWVLFNLSSNRDPNQIAYLAENNGVRALCNLLTCSKELDVFWKGCRTVAAVALKGLRNILISGQIAAASDSNGYNKMAALVAEAHGVERIEALTIHVSADVRTRARLLLERMFGAERTTADYFPVPSTPTMANLSTSVSATTPSCCQCTFQQQHHHHSHSTTTSSSTTTHYSNIYDVNTNFSSSNSNHTSASNTLSSSHLNHGIATVESTTIQLQSEAEFDPQGSTSGSSTDSDPEEDDSDADLIPPPPAPCSCVLCTDPTPLADRRPRGKNSFDDSSSNDGKRNIHEDRRGEIRQICNFCSGGGRLGDGRAGLAAKLGRAVRLGHPHCIAILLSRMTWAQRIAATEAPALLHPGGGPPDGGVGNSLPAFILAAQLGKPDCLALLLRRCRPELDLTYGKKRLTALAWAAHKGYQKCCELLIESGASPSTKCGDGVTALHLAASAGGQIGICKLLLDHGAPVNIRSAKKQTPLCLAAQKGAAKIVQLLLDHEADANNEDESKCTPLHLAASNGFVNCVEPLLKAGAKVDATARKDVTPLHYAVKRGHAAVVQVLIAAGAKVNCIRQPLLLIAADEGNLKVVQILLDANAQIDCKANIRAMLDKDTEILDYLTPLHFASSRGHRNVVELLLRRGANVNEPTTKSGWSALDFAVLNGHADTAITLLQHNARVTDNCKNIGTNKWTLIQYAAHHGAKDVVRLLVQRLKEQGTSLSQQPENGIQSSMENGDDDTTLTDPAFADSSGINNGSLKPWLCIPESKISANDYHEDHGIADHYTLCENDCRHGAIDNMNQGTHRYDLKSGDGGDPTFSPQSSSYSNGPGATEGSSKPNVSRRRVVKDDRQTNIRAREIRKREAEATEARDRLEEAISQPSVAKLNEAITHVSKLVLHLAATGATDGTGNASHLDRDINGYSSHSDSYGGHIHSPSGKHSSSPTNSVLSSPLPMEVGLGNEVKKAQKILAGLLAEEKRAREEKEREAADSKRESAQQSVRKAITNALEGGDARSLSKATNRATRTVLDKDDPVVMEAITVITLISDLEKWESSLRISVHRKDLEGLSEALPKTTEAISELKNLGGEGAAERVFGGSDPSETVQTADALLQELKEKRQNEIAKEEKARDLEKSAKAELEHAMTANDIQKLEKALGHANAALLSKESDLSSSIEAAKKVMTKWLKGERRKLRQATNTEDPETIEKAVMIAEKFNLNALKGDIENAKGVADKIRKQSETRCRLEDAIERGDVIALTEIRKELNILGMFSEAEKARAQIERFQRATRARTLLEGAIADAKTCQEPIIKSFSESKSVDEIMDVISSWTWPDVQKLYDLAARARKYGQSLQFLCDSADNLAKELAVLGRKILAVTVKSDDARAIAANIAGYEKSFMNVAARDIFDIGASEKAVAETKKRLAEVQAMDQESVKAEAAQNKVVYALATSRRSAARHRGTRKLTDPRVSMHGSVDNLSPRTGRPNGRSAMQTDTRSPSSVTSDGVNDEISEVDTPMNSMNPMDGTPNRGNDPTKSASKRNRVATSQIDDSAFVDSIGDSTTSPTGECSHFYMYREGTTVCCSRCGNLRNSSNPEWLARVKRRSNKIGPEYTGTSPTIHLSTGDGQMKVQKHNAGLLPPNANAMTATGLMSSGISTTTERSMPNATRSNLGPYAQQPVAQNYGLGSMPIGIDSTRVPLPALAMRGSNPNTNMSIMVQLMQHQQAQQAQQAQHAQHAQHLAQSQAIPPQVLSQHQLAQAISKAGNNHGRGRTRAPINQISNNMEAHSQGITGIYRNSASARRAPLSGNVSIADAVHMQSAYAGSTMHGMTPRLSAQQAQLRGYQLPSASVPGMDLKNSLRLGSDLNVNAMNGMSQTHVLHMDSLNMNHQARTNMVPSGRMNVARPGNADEVGPSGVDLGHEFANENFGFDIDEIVDDTPRSPANKPATSTPDLRTQIYMQSSATTPTHQHHNGYYQS